MIITTKLIHLIMTIIVKMILFVITVYLFTRYVKCRFEIYMENRGITYNG